MENATPFVLIIVALIGSGCISVLVTLVANARYQKLKEKRLSLEIDGIKLDNKGKSLEIYVNEIKALKDVVERNAAALRMIEEASAMLTADNGRLKSRIYLLEKFIKQNGLEVPKWSET